MCVHLVRVSRKHSSVVSFFLPLYNVSILMACFHRICFSCGNQIANVFILRLKKLLIVSSGFACTRRCVARDDMNMNSFDVGVGGIESESDITRTKKEKNEMKKNNNSNTHKSVKGKKQMRKCRMSALLHICVHRQFEGTLWLLNCFKMREREPIYVSVFHCNDTRFMTL